jgi:hypothetical protein
MHHLENIGESGDMLRQGSNILKSDFTSISNSP